MSSCREVTHVPKSSARIPYSPPFSQGPENLAIQERADASEDCHPP